MAGTLFSLSMSCQIDNGGRPLIDAPLWHADCCGSIGRLGKAVADDCAGEPAGRQLEWHDEYDRRAYALRGHRRVVSWSAAGRFTANDPSGRQHQFCRQPLPHRHRVSRRFRHGHSVQQHAPVSAGHVLLEAISP